MSYSLLLDVSGVSAKGELSSSLGEGGKTCNGQVLVVQLLVQDTLLSSPDRVKDVGLASIISVSTHSKVHFVGVGVLVEGHSDTELEENIIR